MYPATNKNGRKRQMVIGEHVIKTYRRKREEKKGGIWKPDRKLLDCILGNNYGEDRNT